MFGLGNACGNNGSGNSWGWIINLIIIIVVLEFLTQIICGCGDNEDCGCNNTCGCNNNNNCGCGNDCCAGPY